MEIVHQSAGRDADLDAIETKSLAEVKACEAK
jgi:hypothetical protein